ncbi:hypothetical protein BCO71033_01898 [Burkholderia contaminans]|uniref:Lipoprotein n=1 Tax=Burkholderia contaminans TaxID=488447 RepID=A0A6P2X2I1_9BURK|nr:hypothetical protein BCO71033_01898 [Burkholderia contaminans]
MPDGIPSRLMCPSGPFKPMSIRKTSISCVAWLAGAFFIASSAQAEGPSVLPRSEQADNGYASTQLLLKPCVDVRKLSDDPDDELLKAAAAARAALPPGTCDIAALAEKVFAARFLQYATLAVVDDPWNIDEKIDAQNRAIGRCKDTRCLDRELDAVIGALSPLYLHAHPVWPRGNGLCTNAPVDARADRALAPLGTRVRKALARECGDEAVIAQTCDGPHGKMLFVSCEMSGNQVNAQQWLYRARKRGFEPLLGIDDGPVGVLDTTCNGWPDLKTMARISMGEHQATYYRYDGGTYQPVYSYTETGVGSDDNGRDLVVAQGGPSVRVTCR